MKNQSIPISDTRGMVENYYYKDKYFRKSWFFVCLKFVKRKQHILAAKFMLKSKRFE